MGSRPLSFGFRMKWNGFRVLDAYECFYKRAGFRVFGCFYKCLGLVFKMLVTYKQAVSHNSLYHSRIQYCTNFQRMVRYENTKE